MNLNDLWSGNNYAYYEWKGRGEVYRPDAKPVKVIRTFKKQQFGNTKATGYAEVMFLNEDETPKLTLDGEQIIRSVRARDVAMRWDAYVEERAHREAERDRLAQEQEQREREKNEKEEKFRNALIAKYGLPAECISSIEYNSIRLSRHVLEKELGLV